MRILLDSLNFWAHARSWSTVRLPSRRYSAARTTLAVSRELLTQATLLLEQARRYNAAAPQGCARSGTGIHFDSLGCCSLNSRDMDHGSASRLGAQRPQAGAVPFCASSVAVIERDDQTIREQKRISCCARDFAATPRNILLIQFRIRERILSRVWTAFALSNFCKSRKTLRPSCSSRMTLLWPIGLSN
jgi:hypothetical protein